MKIGKKRLLIFLSFIVIKAHAFSPSLSEKQYQCEIDQNTSAVIKTVTLFEEECLRCPPPYHRILISADVHIFHSFGKTTFSFEKREDDYWPELRQKFEASNGQGVFILVDLGFGLTHPRSMEIYRKDKEKFHYLLECQEIGNEKKDFF